MLISTKYYSIKFRDFVGYVSDIYEIDWGLVGDSYSKYIHIAHMNGNSDDFMLYAFPIIEYNIERKFLRLQSFQYLCSNREFADKLINLEN